MSITATCHCGATQIELPYMPKSATECNCTFCARTGALWAYFKPGELTFVSTDHQKSYSASGDMNAHYFCANCGNQTWGESPDWASLFNTDGTPKNGDLNTMPTERTHSFNLRMITDFDQSTVEITRVNGRHDW